jgi:hypothetical protein
MDEREFAAYAEYIAAIPKPDWRVSCPCIDCPGWFAQEMRAQDACDGTPGRRARPTTAWPSRSPEYLRERQRERRRRLGMVDVKARKAERIARAVELRDMGLDTAETARLMGVARKTVGEYLRAAAA